MPAPAVLSVELPGIPRRSRGKVRDIFEIDTPEGRRLLLVATDRISAFDVVMANGIPGKGIVLTQISRFWFERFSGRVRSHLLTTRISEMPEAARPHRELLAGRTMLAESVRIIPFECVVRGYLAGSGWKEYRKDGTVCGTRLPAGLRESDRLPAPIFTPATKEESGHDINVSEAFMAGKIGADLTGRLRDLSLRIYGEAAETAAARGIIIADTKFEFGLDESGEIVLADEVLTPDSSRFWPAEDWKPGGSPPSFDKQFLRDWLERSGWAKTPPGPELPQEVVRGTSDRYREAYERLTGSPLSLDPASFD